jgi:hypothetical protein
MTREIRFLQRSASLITDDVCTGLEILRRRGIVAHPHNQAAILVEGDSREWHRAFQLLVAKDFDVRTGETRISRLIHLADLISVEVMKILNNIMIYASVSDPLVSVSHEFTSLLLSNRRS